ncbi:MAG: peptidoglycan DD-metalloendopeptidase family protein, partial [Planctomycetes bacterium]|nr:peptidoglycan DD-metalloendopeptidase family protein [Planctomycetota bacterium]
VYQGYNPAEGDYGHVIVAEHTLDGAPIWALYGHLSAHSLTLRNPGDGFPAGAVLGWLGDVGENGGWPPHVHFQLSRVQPEGHDMPGVVDPALEDAMRERYPDPRTVLGPLW